MGVIVASQQYFFLQMEKDVALSRQGLERSFLITVKTIGGQLAPEIDKELAGHKELIEAIESSAAGVIGQVEVRVIADVIAWCVVFVISGWALFLNNRKQPKPGVPPAVSSASSE